MLADEQATPEQVAALREMTGMRRMQLAEQLYWFARKMKKAGLQAQHIDWTEEQINCELVRIFLHART
ncbi:MAG: hypothetical protein JWM99_2761 [Verrucomicrobiales bacterium]|nr:hypothetical protein [Verrucomicrobiales bacterium]